MPFESVETVRLVAVEPEYVELLDRPPGGLAPPGLLVVVNVTVLPDAGVPSGYFMETDRARGVVVSTRTDWPSPPSLPNVYGSKLKNSVATTLPLFSASIFYWPTGPM